MLWYQENTEAMEITSVKQRQSQLRSVMIVSTSDEGKCENESLTIYL
jgi:hypothetical protein